MNASVILIRCPKNKGVFGARTQQMNDGDWWRTWLLLLMKTEQKEKDTTRRQ